jgi:hypothetical protein
MAQAFALLLALAFVVSPTPTAQRTPPPAAADARIVKARNVMRPLGREASLGPWRLFTDAAMGELTGLDDVAGRLAEVHTARYGLSSPSGEDENVVIFAGDGRYRAFVETDGSASFRTRGHAGAGLAVFALRSTPRETRTVLVHELTHLLSERAVGPSIPTWLDEGIADDLAWCRVDAEGRVQPGTFDALEIPVAWSASARAGRLFPLSALLSPASRFFTDPGTRRQATTESAMLVRWCLAEPARAARFRAFLRSVSGGGPGDASALAATLGMPASDLENLFFEWSKSL